MKEPQNRHGQPIPIVLQIRRLRRLVRMLLVLDAPPLHPHLNLLLDHLVVKRHVRLRRKQSVWDIYALHRRVLAVPPDLDLGPWLQQAARGLDRGWVDDLVLVHLVEVDLVVVGAKELHADGVEGDFAVAQLPVTGRCWGDLGAEKTA